MILACDLFKACNINYGSTTLLWRKVSVIYLLNEASKMDLFLPFSTNFHL